MITIIEGPAKSGKTALANSMRDRHISVGGPLTANAKKGWKPNGSLLLDEPQDGEPRYLIEKLLHGDTLPSDGSPVKADELNWKHDPQVIIVGKKQEKLLETFEELVPGFTKRVGPVKRLKVTNA